MSNILQHSNDNIKSAFHCILYQPYIAVIIAYVAEEFILIPVGAVFGSCNRLSR